MRHHLYVRRKEYLMNLSDAAKGLLLLKKEYAHERPNMMAIFRAKIVMCRV